MDKDTREHLAALVGRLRGWLDPSRMASQSLRVDLGNAAEAIEDLVASVDRLAEYITISKGQG